MPIDKDRKHTPRRQKRGEIPGTRNIAVLRRIILEALFQRGAGLTAERNGGEGFAASMRTAMMRWPPGSSTAKLIARWRLCAVAVAISTSFIACLMLSE
jgi:hypothetical protein